MFAIIVIHPYLYLIKEKRLWLSKRASRLIFISTEPPQDLVNFKNIDVLYFSKIFCRYARIVRESTPTTCELGGSGLNLVDMVNHCFRSSLPQSFSLSKSLVHIFFFDKAKQKKTYTSPLHHDDLDWPKPSAHWWRTIRDITPTLPFLFWYHACFVWDSLDPHLSCCDNHAQPKRIPSQAHPMGSPLPSRLHCWTNPCRRMEYQRLYVPQMVADCYLPNLGAEGCICKCCRIKCCRIKCLSNRMLSNRMLSNRMLSNELLLTGELNVCLI